jgi:hypothetical protein
VSAVQTFRMTCEACGFTTYDLPLMQHHSCEVHENGGVCEDYPCCGHEQGDCNGQRYGSDESIKEAVERAWATGHGHCDHAEGIYECEYDDEEEE